MGFIVFYVSVAIGFTLGSLFIASIECYASKNKDWLVSTRARSLKGCRFLLLCSVCSIVWLPAIGVVFYRTIRYAVRKHPELEEES